MSIIPIDKPNNQSKEKLTCPCKYVLTKGNFSPSRVNFKILISRNHKISFSVQDFTSHWGLNQ